MYPCLGDQKDEKWRFHAANGSVSNDCGLCLATREAPQAPDTSVQLWIKPQAASKDDGRARVAALLINNSPRPFRAAIDFAAHLNLGRPKNYNGEIFTDRTIVSVRDVWMRRDMEGDYRGNFSWELPPFDSGLFLFVGAPSRAAGKGLP